MNCILIAIMSATSGIIYIIILRTVKEASAVGFAEACKKLVFSTYC